MSWYNRIKTLALPVTKPVPYTISALSQNENSMGRFLKSQSNIDKTRAGKMMAAVGKSQSFAAQQRLTIQYNTTTLLSIKTSITWAEQLHTYNWLQKDNSYKNAN